MSKRCDFHGPMTPDGAPPIATRHLCYAGLFSPGPTLPQSIIIPQTPPPPPEPPKPLVMPQPDPEAQKLEAERKVAAARAKTTTRASTILGDDQNDRLGGG